MKTTWIIAALSAGTALAGGHECWRCAQPGYEAATGRDLRVFPPHPRADFRHMALDVLIENMNTPVMKVEQRLTFVPLGESAESLSLDAKALKVESVSAAGYVTTFDTDGAKLRVTFDPPLEAGREVTLHTSYTVMDPPLGLIWTPESPAWPGRAAQLHTQGQPETNSYWFPCHDFPNDRLTTEIRATVPQGFLVVSNGRLAERQGAIRSMETALGDSELRGYEVYRWVQDTPHVPYLVSLVVGKFDVVDVGDKALSMPVYAPVGRGKDVPAVFGRTRDMAAYFAKVLDEPYPWAQYAQVSVWNFGSGGMENTGATTLHEHVVTRADALADFDQDGLIAHELAHQWFGDLVTCNSWEHIWLNEGLATFMNTLWLERRDGKDAYLAEVQSLYDGLIAKDHAAAPTALPMASKAYRDPWDTFSRPANPYGKGASIAHMLRVRLGDEVFFKGLATFIDRHKFETAETADLRRAFEDASGESLEQFFAQWVFRPGVPHVTVTPKWDAGTGTLSFEVEQTQTIDGDNPAFEFDLPVEIAQAGGATTIRERIEVRGRNTTASIVLGEKPAWVAIDPDLGVLASVTVNADEAAFLAQLDGTPGMGAKLAAVRGLHAPGSDAGSERLRRVVADRSSPVALRVAAVRALTARGAQGDVRAVATHAIDAWQVREATTSALGDILAGLNAGSDEYARPRLIEQLTLRAQKDASTIVRAAALRALGRGGATEAQGVMLAALGTPSQGDTIRQAGLEALAMLKTPEAVKAAMRLTGQGFESRTRAAAATALASLGPVAGEEGYSRLVALLDDREVRVRRAAGEGLVQRGEARGESELRARAATARGPDLARWFTNMADDLKAKLSGN
ncbi:MAG: aminopeptidase [Phycisphaerae bacterium]|nr:MAG: aminopeptidase [Phycisphaerae bacterium]